MDGEGGDVSVSQYDVVQAALDAFGRQAGFLKRSSTWHRRQPETIAVLNLQRSQYGPQYYVNVALWLLPLGETDAPKEHKCHVRTRLGTLVGPAREGRVAALLDLEAAIDEETRRDEVLGILRSDVLPVLDACGTIDGLRSPVGERLVRQSLVVLAAQELLRSSATG